MRVKVALKWLEAVANFIAAASLAVVSILTVTAIVLRAVGENVPDALDFASLFMGISMFWGIAVAVRGDDLIRADFIQMLAGKRVAKTSRWFANLVSALMIALMGYAIFQHIQIPYHSGEVTPQLRIQIWPLVAFGWVGFLLAVVFAFHALRKDALPED